MSNCSLCHRLDIRSFTDWDGTLLDVPHQPSLSQLEDASSSGCPLCTLIFSALTTKLANEPPLDSSIWESSSPITLRGVQYVIDDEDFEPGGLFWIKARCDAGGPFAYAYFSLETDKTEGVQVGEDMVIGRKVHAPDSKESFELLRRWIQECEANHAACAASGTLPTRVINVGRDGQDFVKLEETTPGTREKYMTLSHCWGPTPHLVIRTTKTTLSRHVQGIPLSDLTNTFRDAVLVTRAAGMKYIWIDSLCIVQDDEQDWARESAKMGFIYADSYLTVAASASPDSTGGCFHHNRKSELPPGRIKCTTPDGVGYVYVRPRLGDFLTLHRSPLHTRAWVQQERILSSRTIHYDRDQMLWECRELRACESGVPENAFVSQRRIWDGRLHFREGEQRASGRAFWYDWYDLVASYTTHGLTKGEDKLPALSGLAQTLESATGGSYVAGLWKEHMPFGLLWRKTGEWLRPAPTYRAPTWSWAAWDGRMSFYNEADLEGGSTRVISTAGGMEASVKPSGLDQRGKLSSGCLKITAQLKAADERMSPSAPNYRKLPGVMESLMLTVDYLTMDGVIFGLAFFDEDYEPDRGPVYCLRIARMESSLGQDLPSLFFTLLLQPTGVENEYSRIGVGEQREVGVGRHQGPLSSQPNFFADAPTMTVTII